MTNSTPIDNTADVIDSREIIERIDTLEALWQDSEISEDNGGRLAEDDNGNPIVLTATCGTCGRSWNDAIVTDRTPAPSGRCPYESIHDELAELAALQSLASEAEGYADDWHHGEALIRDSYFTEYAEQLAIDCAPSHEVSDLLAGKGFGDMWPMQFVTIDWEAAAAALKEDYTAVEFGGVTYWIR